MRFQRLDLNLLVALDALLTEKSVSLAADRICLSQSATSSALGRLRDYFNDELLVMKGRQMVLTARGEELVEPVSKVLQQVRNTIAVAPEFDPATSDRTISIMASDYATEVLLSEALRQFATTAPGMCFEIKPLNDQLVETLERGGMDILITIDCALSQEHPRELLFSDDYVVLAWDENSAVIAGIDAELYFRLGHVTTRFGAGRVPAFEDWFMRNQSMPRRVEVVAPSFLSVPSLLIGSERIGTVHRRLAERMVKHLPLRILPLPFDMPGIRSAAQWLESNSKDKAIAWVVSELKRVGAPPPGAVCSDSAGPVDFQSRSAPAAPFRMPAPATQH